jgi:hypothetical protein
MRGEIPSEVCVARNWPGRFSSCSFTDPPLLSQQLHTRNFTHEDHLFLVLRSDDWTSVIITVWGRWNVKELLKQYIRWAQYYRNVTDQIALSGNACDLQTLFGMITVQISAGALTIIKRIFVDFLAPPDKCRYNTLNNAKTASFQVLFNLLFTTVVITNRNLIQEEIKRRLNSGNARYHSILNLSSSRLLSKTWKSEYKKL